MMNGSSVFENSTHGKVLHVCGIPSTSSSGSTDLVERVKEAETIIYEDGTVVTKKLEALAGIFRGELKAVTGSFKSLSCLDPDGNELGYIQFGTTGTVDFVNFNLRHNKTFRSNDLFCRGAFGARSRTAVIVYGTYARYFYQGLENSAVYYEMKLQSSTDGDGYPFYYLPIYGSGAMGDVAGMPVDLVIIKQSGTTTRRYCILATRGKKFTIVNANDDNNNIYIYINNATNLMDGGSAWEMVDVGYDNVLPARSESSLGAGLMVISKFDNNW